MASSIIYLTNRELNLPGGQWYHITAVFDGTQAERNQRAKLYINGMSSANGRSGDYPSSLKDDSGPVIVGDKFVGSIDVFRIYNRALSEAEIKALYSE